MEEKEKKEVEEELENWPGEIYLHHYPGRASKGDIFSKLKLNFPKLLRIACSACHFVLHNARSACHFVWISIKMLREKRSVSENGIKRTLWASPHISYVAHAV